MLAHGELSSGPHRSKYIISNAGDNGKLSLHVVRAKGLSNLTGKSRLSQFKFGFRKFSDYLLRVVRREEIDWVGLRAAAVAIGVREAARRAAADLPPDEQRRFVERALKRSSREHWLEIKAAPKPPERNEKPMSANVRKGSDVLSEVLAEDSRETRIGLSAAARKAAETLAKMPGSKVIKHAQAHRHLTASSSVLHGWDDKGNPIPFTLNVLNLGSLGVQVRRTDTEEQ